MAIRHASPNREAYLLLTSLIERLGLTRRGFLDRLAESGFVFGEHDLVNWGRSGRAFPRDWAALRAMIQVVTEGHPDTLRCTAAEALRFLQFAEMPFAELQMVAALFPPDEFNAALVTYLPSGARVTLHPFEPYIGLHTFQEENAAFFFGREKLTDQLVQKATDSSFLAVLGPSGSGKSSVVRAGLLPALKRGALPGSQTWRYITIRPGPDPIGALAAAVVALQGRDQPGRVTEMRYLFAHEPRGLLDEATLLLAGHSKARFVLVVDQFEELWTQAPSAWERQTFVQLLLTTAAMSQGVHSYLPFLIILAMRADFLPHAAENRELAHYIGEHDVIVSPMKPDELRRAIEQPADKVGGGFEPLLADELIEQVIDRPGSLPLLEYTLLELWKLRNPDGVMSWKAFRDLGGVEGALATRADTILATRYTLDQQEELRHLLLRLVQPGEGATDTRRRAFLDDLVLTGGTIDAVQDLLEPLIDDRLLTADLDPATNEETIELSHEALIHSWPTFGKWIAEAREALHFQVQLEEAVREWESNNYPSDFLWHGLRLARAEEWLSQMHFRLNERTQHFLDASRVQEQEAVTREEAARREHEMLLEAQAAAERAARDEAEARAAAEYQRAEEQTKVRRRFGALAAGLLVLLVLAVTAIWVALNNQRILDARGLAFAAQRRVDTPPETALLLAIEAALRYPDVQTEQALRDAVEQVSWITTVLNDHSGPVTGAVFSPDGQRLLTASADKMAKLWDLTGQVLVTFEGHTGEVMSAVFNPDGQRVLTASADKTAKLWDLTGQVLVTFEGHTGEVTGALFKPEGQQVLTTSADSTARLWDLTGRSVVTFTGHTAAVTSAVFSPDSQQILTASEDNTAGLWDLEGARLALFAGHSDKVTSVAFSPDGQSILTASQDTTARLWDLTGRSMVTFTGHTDTVWLARFSPDGQRVLTVSTDRTGRLYELNGALVAVLRGHNRGLIWAAFSQDGQRILTASRDGTAQLWNLEGRTLNTFGGHTNWLVSAVFSPVEKHVLTASIDGTARLYESLVPTFDGHTGGVVIVVFSPDGQSILTASEDGTARLWNLAGRLRAPLAGHLGSVSRAIFSPDGQSILTASNDGTAILWDLTGTPLTTFRGHDDEIETTVFSPDGQQILTASDDKTARLWDLSGTTITVFDGHTRSVETAVFSPDGQSILTASEDSTARLWDLTGHSVVTFTGHTAELQTAVFSPDGQLVLTASRDYTARLWDLTGQTLAIFEGHNDQLMGAIFAPDGQRVLTLSRDHTAGLWELDGTRLAVFSHTDVVHSAVFSSDRQRALTASDDGTARLWNLEGELLAIFRGHDDWVTSAVFSPDEQYILTASRDRTVRQHLVEMDDLLAAAVCRVGRGLTDEEIAQFNVGRPRFVFEQRQCPPVFSWQE